MTVNTSNYPWGEAQIREINAKNTDPIALEVWEMITSYNYDLSEQEKKAVKLLISSENPMNDENYSEEYKNLKSNILQRSENTKKYGKLKLNVNEELFKELTAEAE